VGPRRPVPQTVQAELVEPPDPSVGALPRDTKLLRDVRDGPAIDPDPPNEQTTTVKRQPSISVSHEDLRLVKTGISTAPGGLRMINKPRRSVTNLVAEYS
jgi:hypothetical protein